MPIVAYSRLSRGFFSGRFRAGDYETARKVLDLPAQQGYLSPGNMERLRRAEFLAARDNCSVAFIAMRYVFSSELNLFAVCATGSPERMRQNIAASICPLSPEDLRFLEEGNSN